MTLLIARHPEFAAGQAPATERLEHRVNVATQMRAHWHAVLFQVARQFTGQRTAQ